MKQSIETRLAALEAWRDETGKDAEIKKLRAENEQLHQRLLAEQMRCANAEIRLQEEKLLRGD